MGERKWHVEHADGRAVTRGELDDIVARDYRGREVNIVPRWWFNVLSEDGRLMLADGLLGLHGVMASDDLVVRWRG